MAGSFGKATLNLLRNCQTRLLPKVAAPFTSQQQSVRVPVCGQGQGQGVELVEVEGE